MNTSFSSHNEWAKGPKFCFSLFASFVLAFLSASSLFAQQSFVPNDPYFYTDNPAGFLGQWYLDKQTSGATVDINVQGAWQRGLTGQGVTIGFVSLGGIEYTHPDLAPNYDSAESWNFVDNNNDPSVSDPSNFDNAHDSACTGLAVAKGGNGIGITGVAPYSSFAVLKAINGGVYQYTDNVAVQRVCDATRFHSIGASPTIQIKSYSFSQSSAYYEGYRPDGRVASNFRAIDQALADSALAGTINIVPANNFRGTTSYNRSADANKKGKCHIPEVITVTAVNSQGTFAQYAGYGSCITATVPSGETFGSGGLNLTTTDLQGTNGYNPNISDTFPDQDYTSTFSGTSASAPIMAGVLALAKQAQPNLDTRFAKHLLADTCHIVDATDSTPMGGWITNAAGYHFNNNYGFGLVDADALTLAATQYSGVTPLITHDTGIINVGTNIPMGNTLLSQTFTLPSEGHLEEVLVHMNIQDPWFVDMGKLQAILESPTGTESILIYPELSEIAYSQILDWSFMSNAFWGEESGGTWTLTLQNADSAYAGETVWNSFDVTARYGDLIPVPEPGTLALCASALVAGLVFLQRRQRFAFASAA